MAVQKRLSSEKRKEQIKEKILEIIFKEGMHKLSTRYLAQKVGVSEGALFRHYATKSAMIEDIINDVRIELIDKLHDIATNNKPAEKRLEEFICRTINYLYDKKGITLLLFTEASYKNDEGLKEIMNENYNLQKEFFMKIVLDGIAEGIWDDSIQLEHLASLYMGIPVTLNIETILHSNSFNHQNFCLQMKNFILKILSK